MKMKPLLLSFLVLGGLAAAQGFDGAKLYSTNCSGCHQAGGQGIPGVFPPLAGHVPQILEAKGGREYLIHVMLYGLQGPIEVKGTKYSGAMPAWAQLKDGEIAAILNHISTSWGNKFPEGQKPFTPEEVGAGRAQKLTAAQVLEARKALGLK